MCGVWCFDVFVKEGRVLAGDLPVEISKGVLNLNMLCRAKLIASLDSCAGLVVVTITCVHGKLCGGVKLRSGILVLAVP